MQTASARRPHPTSFDGPPPPEALRSRHPRLMEYLDELPAGVYSYPECKGRAGILNVLLEAMPPLPAVDPWVESVLRPSPRPFVPEVMLQSAFLAIADAAAMTDEQVLAWNRALNRRLYGGLLYRALMSLFSPQQLVERAPKRWESFHQGTTLVVKTTGVREVVAGLAFPANLFRSLALRGYAGAFAAALEHARGRDVTVQLDTATATSAEFVARWR